jgi:hypothetical protein
MHSTHWFSAFLALHVTWITKVQATPSAIDDFESVVEKAYTPPRALDETFERYFPYYFKYCATSKFHPKHSFGQAGGSAGHAVFYIKGACQDKQSGPSAIKLCPESADYTSSATGVSVSVNKNLRNVNFFVFPTLDVLVGKYEGSGLSWRRKSEIVQEVLQTKAFEGIAYHDGVIPSLIEPEFHEEYMARDAFGTDFGLSYARHMYCMTIPMTRPAVKEIVHYLNSLNNHLSAPIKILGEEKKLMVTTTGMAFTITVFTLR